MTTILVHPTFYCLLEGTVAQREGGIPRSSEKEVECLEGNNIARLAVVGVTEEMQGCKNQNVILVVKGTEDDPDGSYNTFVAIFRMIYLDSQNENWWWLKEEVEGKKKARCRIYPFLHRRKRNWLLILLADDVDMGFFLQRVLVQPRPRNETEPLPLG